MPKKPSHFSTDDQLRTHVESMQKSDSGAIVKKEEKTTVMEDVEQVVCSVNPEEALQFEEKVDKGEISNNSSPQSSDHISAEKEISPTAMPKNHECDKCPFEARCPSNLEEHAKSAHDTIKDVEQVVCSVNPEVALQFEEKSEKGAISNNNSPESGDHVSAENEVSPTALPKIHTCDKCPFEARYPSQLKEHVKSVHDKIKEWMSQWI